MLQLPTASGKKIKEIWNWFLTCRWLLGGAEYKDLLMNVLWTDSLCILPKETGFLCLEILLGSFCCSEKKGWVSQMMHSAVAPIYTWYSCLTVVCLVFCCPSPEHCFQFIELTSQKKCLRCQMSTLIPAPTCCLWVRLAVSATHMMLSASGNQTFLPMTTAVQKMRPMSGGRIRSWLRW